MEAFFGCAPPTPSSSSSSSGGGGARRELRRGAWSSDVNEEDAWVAALLAQARARASYSASSSSARVRAADCECEAADATTSLATTVGSAGIPKIVHFVWLGGGPIPSFPFLGDGPPSRGPPDAADDDEEGGDVHRGCDEDGGDDDDAAKERSSSPRDPRDVVVRLWNECMESWRARHPPSDGWTFHVWTERDVLLVDRAAGWDDDDEVGDRGATKKRGGVGDGRRSSAAFRLDAAEMRNVRGYRRALQIRNYGMASDVLRLEILHKYGGVYVDVDYWCVDRLDDVFVAPGEAEGGDATMSGGDPIQFFCGASNAGCVELNNGLMACRRGGHPILWNMMNAVREYFEFEGASSASSPPAATPTIAPPPAAATLPLQGSMASLLSSFLDPAAADALAASTPSTQPGMSAMEVIERTGPGLLTRTVCRWLVGNNGPPARGCSRGDDATTTNTATATTAASNESFDASGVVVFPSVVFHPFPNHLRGALRRPSSSGGVAADARPSDADTPRALLEASVVPGETRAIHLWGCSWQRGG